MGRSDKFECPDLNAAWSIGALEFPCGKNISGAELYITPRRLTPKVGTTGHTYCKIYEHYGRWRRPWEHEGGKVELD